MAYPPVEPHAHGLLDVGGGQRLYWEACGSAGGAPAVALHGGPGSGCTPWWRTLFDPAAYRAILFDQRNCGRSTPHAGEPGIDLTANTTANQIADVERLREHLGVERWLVLGGSWGAVLAQAYAEAHPRRVSQLVLFGVPAGDPEEFDWLFRGGLGELFPEQWERFTGHLPERLRGDPVEGYAALLHDPDPEVCRAAAHAWCLWESATPHWPPGEALAERFRDPVFALAFARIVNHYARHGAWLERGALLRGAGALAGIPGVLVNGRYDLQAKLGPAWRLARAWPAPSWSSWTARATQPAPSIEAELVRATDRFSRSG